MELSKDLLHFGRSSFTGVMMMRYNIHGISPPFVLWIWFTFIIQNGDRLCDFYLQITAEYKSAVYQL